MRFGTVFLFVVVGFRLAIAERRPWGVLPEGARAGPCPTAGPVVRFR